MQEEEDDEEVVTLIESRRDGERGETERSEAGAESEGADGFVESSLEVLLSRKEEDEEFRETDGRETQGREAVFASLVLEGFDCFISITRTAQHERTTLKQPCFCLLPRFLEACFDWLSSSNR